MFGYIREIDLQKIITGYQPLQFEWRCGRNHGAIDPSLIKNRIVEEPNYFKGHAWVLGNRSAWVI